MSRPLVTILTHACLAAAAVGSDTLRLLPERPEVVRRGVNHDEVMLDLRGRDCTALDLVRALAGLEGLDIQVDDAALPALNANLLTVDLRERRAPDVIDLIAAACALEVVRDGQGWRLAAAPAGGTPAPRTGLVRAAQRMYELALTRQTDPELGARALRGMAELYRRSGDPIAAYSLYETLLSDPYVGTLASKDCELYLADCYLALGRSERAGRLLRGFLDRSPDRAAAERALRRLVSVVVDDGRYAEAADLRGALAKLGALEPESVRRLADAAARMLERGAARESALLLGDVFGAAPAEHAALAPVLALALARLGDAAGAQQVLSAGARHLDADPPAAALWALAELAAAADRTGEALVFAHSVLADPEATPVLRRRCHLVLGALYQGVGLAARARSQLYEAELLSAPADAAALARRSAELTLAHGQPDHARLLFQAAADYGLGAQEAQLGVARALFAAGEPDRALERLRNLLQGELSPELQEQVRLLGTDCLEAGGDFAGALRLLDGDLTALEAEGRS